MAPKPKKGKARWVKLKRAPYGSYDLGLDQAERASRRGLRDMVSDIDAIVPGKRPGGTESRRSLYDVMLARTEGARQQGILNQDYGLGVADVNRGYGRTLEDLMSQQQTLQRNYAQLGNQQRQAFQAGGLAEGGAVAQAAQKRAQNQAFEQAPIDVARTRAGEDRQLSLDDLLRQQQRANKDLSNQTGQTNLIYGRGVEDRATQLSRARREANQYKQDLNQTRMQQYLQTGGKRRIKVTPKRFRKLKHQGAI